MKDITYTLKTKKIPITIAVIALISTFAYLRYLDNGWLSINKTTEIKEIKPDTTAVNSQQNTEIEIPEVIIKLSAHNTGAGSQTKMNIDLIKDALTIEVINTMEEDLPTDISTKKIPAHKPYLFETAEPHSLVAQI